MESNNRVARIIGFMDFEEVEIGGVGIGDMEEGDVLGWENIEGSFEGE